MAGEIRLDECGLALLDDGAGGYDLFSVAVWDEYRFL